MAERCRSRGMGPELIVDEYAHGDAAMQLVDRGPLGLAVFGSSGDDGLRCWDCVLPEGHGGEWCMSAVACEPGWPGPLRVYWRHAGPFGDIDECFIVRCVVEPVGALEVVEPHEAPVGSLWLCGGHEVRVAALMDAPGRVWVETTEVHPRDRRYFAASTGALEPASP